MKPADIATVVLAVVAAITLIGGFGIWLYKRGGHERAVVDALKDNTNSNHEVAKELKDFKAETLVALRDHDWRLKIAEDKLNDLAGK